MSDKSIITNRDLAERLEALNEVSVERHNDVFKAVSEVQTLVDSFGAKLDLPQVVVPVPVAVTHATVQLGSLASACVFATQCSDTLIGVVLALSALAFGFFVTRLAKI